MDKFEKSLISLRHWLLGKEYYTASEALNFAEKYHTGFRKDGVTPEFYHQVTVAQYIRTIHAQLASPEETLAVAILHDVVEDYAVSVSEIREAFNDSIANSTYAMSKKVRGENDKTQNDYYNGLAEDAKGSIVKGSDRIHNIQSMLGVFTLEKQKEYVAEVEEYVLPMIKKARKNFPHQETAYQNIRLILQSQIDLIAFTWN